MSKTIRRIDDLQPDVSNANKGTERGRYMVEASLRDVGAGRSIVVDKHGRVIAGNKTLEAWADVGGEIEVVRTDGKKLVVVQREDLDLSDDTGAARKLAYFDNRAGEVGLEWDAEELLASLNAGLDLSAMFHDDELDELLAELQKEEEVIEDAEPQIDKAAELQAKWGTATGQLWQLGEHRLICGDCTDPDVVARVMGGEKADMVFTDPPYNIAYNSSENPRCRKDNATIINDKMDAGEWEQFCEKIARLIASVTDGCVYVCHAPGPDGRVMAMSLDRVMHASTTIIWNKDRFTLGRGKYQNKYEPIWFGWVKSGERFTKKRDLANVWDIERPGVSEEHPTMKPVELVVMALEHASRVGDVVFEPFSGSGTTILACEATNRKARAIEISPAYTAVAIDRWATATGKTPVLVG